METILILASLLSIIAFVVGMFNPKIVKCKSRGKVALLYISLFFAFTFLLPAASSPADSSITESEYSNERASKTRDKNTEIESSIGKPIKIGHFIYTINKVEFRKTVGDDMWGETADGIYMLIYLTIKNISDETRTLDESSFHVTDKEGMQYDYSIEGSSAYEISTDSKSVFLKQCHPNVTTKGTLVYEVPMKGEYYLHLAGDFWGTNSVRVLLK